MTGEPHPQRCETCKHYQTRFEYGNKKICTLIKEKAPGSYQIGIPFHIDIVGCASHSASEPVPERIGSIRQTVLQEDAYLIERVNAGMGEWEYIIQYCGEYYATAPTEEIARSIVELAQHTRPILSPVHDEQIRQEARAQVLDELRDWSYTIGCNNAAIAAIGLRDRIESLRQQEGKP